MLMYYRHRLPAEHPMDRIRTRVSERGPLWDAAAGLAFKAFALEEQARGLPENAYASLYLWCDPQAALGFLTDARFAAVIAGFGRPEIETWMPLDVRAGPARRARSLHRSERPVPVGTALGDLARSEAEEGRHLAEAPDVLATVCGLDPGTWRLTRFTLRDAAPAGAGSSAVLHLARPGFPPAARS